MSSLFISEVPIYIILDTNWLIYLSEGQNPYVLQKIREKIIEGKFVLLVPEIIYAEYFQNEDKPIRQLEDLIEKEYDSVRALSEHMNSNDKEIILKLLTKYAESSDKRLEIARQRLESIKELISMHSKLIPTSSNAKELAIMHSLQKQAPMHKKNSFSDALIFFSAYDYFVKKHDPALKNIIFVSNNHEDFSDTKDKDVIHPDLKGYLDKIGMYYERNIGRAFKLSISIEQHIEKMVYKEWEDFFTHENAKQAALGPDGVGII